MTEDYEVRELASEIGKSNGLDDSEIEIAYYGLVAMKHANIQDIPDAVAIRVEIATLLANDPCDDWVDGATQALELLASCEQVTGDPQRCEVFELRQRIVKRLLAAMRNDDAPSGLRVNAASALGAAIARIDASQVASEDNDAGRAMNKLIATHQEWQATHRDHDRDLFNKALARQTVAFDEIADLLRRIVDEYSGSGSGNL